MSGLVEVKIIATVITSRYGALGQGDILRTDAAYARHLIEECHAARYTSSGGPAAQGHDAESAAAAPAARRKKSVK